MMLDHDLDQRTAGQVLGRFQLALTARYQHVLADRKWVAERRVEAAMFGRRKGLGHADRPSLTITAPSTDGVATQHRVYAEIAGR